MRPSADELSTADNDVSTFRSLMNTTTKWPAELANLSWCDLSSSERAAGERLLIDALGTSTAARCADGIEATLTGLGNLAQGGVPVPWTPLRLPPPLAGLALSALIHAWDFDDTHDDAVVHTSAIALPSALVTALHANRDGTDVLNGVVVGVQVLSRLALAIGPRPGMIRTAGLGPLAAAASAARTLGLDEDGIREAMALTLSTSGSPYSRQVVEDGAVNKRLQPGMAVHSGLTSAFLARAGIQGPAGWAEGGYGVLSSAGVDPRVLSAAGWDGARLSLKPYPACRYTHAALAATAAATTDLPAEEAHDTVRHVDVHVPAGAAYELVSRPFARRGKPVIDAQFSIPWLVAAHLITGSVDLTTIAGPTLLDDEVAESAKRVTVHQDGTGTAAMAPATVVVHHADGSRRTATEPMPGSPEHPLDDVALAAKTAACARVGGHDPDRTVAAVAEFVARLPSLSPADLHEAVASLGR